MFWVGIGLVCGEVREGELRKIFMGPYASSWKALRIRSISASFGC